MRQADGSAGDANYGKIGAGYSSYRQPDPNIAALIDKALGSAQTVLNVGAGPGSYEPVNRKVTAVEPSHSMRSQRPAHLAIALNAVAEALPFADNSFDASMATFTVHQWSDLRAGLSEMRRVTRGPVLVLGCDPHLVQKFWLSDYAPQVLEAEARRYPALDFMGSVLGKTVTVIPVPIPLHCKDGFNEAYYGRPECLLDEQARSACSAWSFVDQQTTTDNVDHLRRDLETGAWDLRYKNLRTQPTYDGSLRLLISAP